MPKAVPVDYQPIVKKPDDFDAFWDGVLQQVAAIPLEPEMIPDPLRTSEEVEVFQVFYTSLEHVRIAAWYCRPTRRAEPIPAVLVLPGYQADPPIPKEWALKGYGALSVAPRGKLRSHRQFNPGYPNLLTYNIVDRHTYAYRGFYVDSWRGIDFLLARPEVDPTRLGVTGSSQGGGLTVTTAAMRSEIRAAAAGAPYLCGFMDAIELTHTYPYEEIGSFHETAKVVNSLSGETLCIPVCGSTNCQLEFERSQEINDFLRLHPESRRAVAETVAYFDGINFADKITCP